MHNGKELRVEKYIMSCNRKEGNNQVQHTVHRAPGEYHQQRGENRYERKKVEQVKV
jgi:hypothetical protein